MPEQPKKFPSEWLGIWIDPIGRLVQITDMDSEAQKIRVNVLFRNYLHSTEQNLVANWTLDYRKALCLCIEAGICYFGPTYNLYFVRDYGSYSRFANTSDSSKDIMALPEVQGGLYDTFEDDLGVSWAFPYDNYYRISSNDQEILEIYKNNASESARREILERCFPLNHPIHNGPEIIISNGFKILV